MTDLVYEQKTLQSILPKDTVRLAAKVWFAAAAIGHWIFLAYILAVFFPLVAEHGLEALKGTHLPAGFQEGDTLGNVTSIAHVLLAAIIIGGGPLQLIPAVRNKYPIFHRWLGRSYIFAAVISSAGGLYMTWTRPGLGDLVSQLSISLNGVLIIGFAALAIRYAIGRKFSEHRKYALRLFMVAGGVWFFRVGLMGWTALTGGVGIDFETFTGPFLYFLGIAQYLLPLAMLEWYFYCESKATQGVQMAFVGTLFLMTGFMTFGIFAATMGMWLPRM